jgi:hypothetical protein
MSSNGLSLSPFSARVTINSAFASLFGSAGSARLDDLGRSTRSFLRRGFGLSRREIGLSDSVANDAFVYLSLSVVGTILDRIKNRLASSRARTMRRNVGHHVSITIVKSFGGWSVRSSRIDDDEKRNGAF